jgi:type 1 glutamine amidotransferase
MTSHTALLPNVRLALSLIFALFAGDAMTRERPERSPVVHHIAGSKEYRSAETLEQWAKHLEAKYDIESNVSVAPDKSRHIPNLEKLADADVLVVYARRLEPPEAQLRVIRQFLDEGHPVLGLRTASHAFQPWLEFDKVILGGDYSGHGPGEKDVKVLINQEQADHPVLEGVEPWTRDGKLYRNPELAADTVILLRGQGREETVPLAWVREVGDGRRVFYTSLGFPADFENPQFIKLLDNALMWLLPEQPSP